MENVARTNAERPGKKKWPTRERKDASATFLVQTSRHGGKGLAVLHSNNKTGRGASGLLAKERKGKTKKRDTDQQNLKRKRPKRGGREVDNRLEKNQKGEAIREVNIPGSHLDKLCPEDNTYPPLHLVSEISHATPKKEGERKG